jgi:SAM-dependent methyltransferase
VVFVLDEHLDYVADTIRLERFKAAIAQVVKPGDVVADLGCGSGVLGLLCLQAGAGKVYAVDHSAMIDVARESFQRSGWSDRAVFIHGNSLQIELPERVDVVICDHVGYFGFDYGIMRVLADARQRLLKPSGSTLPARIKLEVAAVDSDACLSRVDGWTAEAVPAEFHWLRSSAVNTKHSVSLAQQDLLSGPVELGTIALGSDDSEFFSFDAVVPIERGGRMRGLGGWFSCELAEGVWMTNDPRADQAINRPQAFLPLSEPVTLSPGDVVKARVLARPDDHLLAWKVDVPAAGRKFSHSTWEGELWSRREFIKRTPTHVPQLSRTGQARLAVLGYCDGSRTVRQIEQAVLSDHPGLFPTAAEISGFVSKVLGQDAE